MTIPYITIGCPTTGGGQVISGNSTFLVQGIPVACIGDKATCPKHTTVSTIVSGDPYMQVMGKSVARVNDSLSCGCKLLPKQNLVVGDTGASAGGISNSNPSMLNSFVNENFSKQYGQRFQITDELTNEPLRNVCYEIIKNGEITHGRTNEYGYTQLITSDTEDSIELNIIYEEHDHG